MLVACRLAGRSALEAYYEGLVALTQSRPRCRWAASQGRAVDMGGGKKGSSRLIRWPRQSYELCFAARDRVAPDTPELSVPASRVCPTEAQTGSAACSPTSAQERSGMRPG